MNANKIKSQFPIFKNNPNLVYLDNAATSQKPTTVIDSEVEFYTKFNANTHRGFYPLAEKATEKYEAARATVAEFINADTSEIIFCPGATFALNHIALMLHKNGKISKGDTVLLSEVEHNSNILPWRGLAGINIEYIKLGKNFSLDYESAKSVRPKVVSLPLVNNVNGEILDLERVRQLYQGAIIILDASQAVGHIDINVKQLNCDFLVFSAHKMYGPMGVGVMFAKQKHLSTLNPVIAGGGTVTTVSKEDLEFRTTPEKFEAGTQPISQAIATGKAVEFIQNLGINKIREHEEDLKNYLLQNLNKIENIKIYRDENRPSTGVVSFSVENIHPHDIAYSLGEINICVRAGSHCANIAHTDAISKNATVRISLAVYNSTRDIDLLISALRDIVKRFQK